MNDAMRLMKLMKSWPFLLCALLLGCSESGGPCTYTSPCPPRVGEREGEIGERFPALWHHQQRVSSSGRYLLYLVGESPRLRLRIIDLNGTMPDTQQVVAAFSPIWSPYSDDRFIINCVVETDIGSWPVVLGRAAFLVERESRMIERIGHPSLLPELPNDRGYRVVSWLPGSRPGRDSILFDFKQRDSTQFKFKRTYVSCLQTGEHTERPEYLGFVKYSPDGKYLFKMAGSDIHHPNGRFFLNDVEFRLSRSASEVGQASWSPDGSRLALEIWPDDVPGMIEIWVLHIDEYLAGESDVMPMHAINLQNQFCFYSLGGVWPEYATNSTLIVAMHRDGDDFSGLWEISDKAGDTYKRSLTSLED
ncbi:MAG: hypothetical protein J4G05_05815 [Chlorobi bacterium]|nr:hypothetical protein [Chlorobiota bacterium]